MRREVMIVLRVILSCLAVLFVLACLAQSGLWLLAFLAPFIWVEVVTESRPMSLEDELYVLLSLEGE